MANALRVLARGGILVLDIEHAMLSGGHRSYVGRTTVRDYDAAKLPAGPSHIASNEFLEPGESPIPHCAYPANATPATVPCNRFFKRAVAAGDLWPFDLETAKACGAPFDPTFGGEFPSLTPKRGKGSD